jgi:hypothetical protein
MLCVFIPVRGLAAVCLRLMMIDGHSHVHIPLLVILVDSNKATGSGDVTVSVLRQHRAL